MYSFCKKKKRGLLLMRRRSVAARRFLVSKALSSVGKKNYPAIGKAVLFQQMPHGNVVPVRVDPYVLNGGKTPLQAKSGNSALRHGDRKPVNKTVGLLSLIHISEPTRP